MRRDEKSGSLPSLIAWEKQKPMQKAKQKHVRKASSMTSAAAVESNTTSVALPTTHTDSNTANNKMAYGSGQPSWSSRGGDVEEGGGLSRRTPHNSNGSINNNNNNNNNGSYQQGGNSSGGGYNYQSNYQAPQLSGKYAEQQTQIMEEAMRTHVTAETTANNVLAKLHAQRHQLQNANDDTWEMRQNVATAQRELKELQQKAWAKKKRLYMIIALLAAADLTLFLRIVQCGGSFFCRHYNNNN